MLGSLQDCPKILLLPRAHTCTRCDQGHQEQWQEIWNVTWEVKWQTLLLLSGALAVSLTFCVSLHASLPIIYSGDQLPWDRGTLAAYGKVNVVQNQVSTQQPARTCSQHHLSEFGSRSSASQAFRRGSRLSPRRPWIFPFIHLQKVGWYFPQWIKSWTQLQGQRVHLWNRKASLSQITDSRNACSRSHHVPAFVHLSTLLSTASVLHVSHGVRICTRANWIRDHILLHSWLEKWCPDVLWQQGWDLDQSTTESTLKVHALRLSFTWPGADSVLHRRVLRVWARSFLGIFWVTP